MAKVHRLVVSAKAFVAGNVGPCFHDRLLSNLQRLKLSKLLKRKNPYLFKAKAIQSAAELVKRLLDAYLSSQEETIFGAFLEMLAIHVCGEAFDGKKSNAEGIDLEFVRDGERYIVSIKSGPSWGNAQAIKRMVANFAQARRIAGKVNLVAVNGCCYGQEVQPEKGYYRKLCGQDFWELISGIDDFYQQIVEPLGTNARLRTDEFDEKYGAVNTQFIAEFIENYCLPSGLIHWNKLLEYNSGRLRLQ